MSIIKSILLRDKALTKRNNELRFLRHLIGQLKERIAELESHTTTNAVDGACTRCGGEHGYHIWNCPMSMGQFKPRH